jgi:pilus assembly protein CpaC
MTRSKFIESIAWLAAGLAVVSLAPAGRAQSAEDLRLTVGKSIVIDYPSDVRQISTSNPEVLDASPVTTREILVQGKGPGNATMIVWSKTGDRTFYNVTVDMNIDPLKRILKESFPNEDITPYTSRDSLTLTGHVSSKEVMDRATLLAAAFNKNVVSNLQFYPAPVDKQILLRVKFAELDRSKEVQYGVNLLGMPGLTNIGTTTGQFGAPAIAGVTGAGPAPLSNQTTIASALNIFALNPKLSLGALIKALQAESILQVLAEPNIVATNGKEAYFLVGGEFPVPVLQGGGNSGAVTIMFREFGIKLIFTPLITANKTIKLHLKQEVSQLDFADGVTISGFTIPALSTRRAETDVELSEGQSFVVAGLVDNQERDSFNKIPILGSLPIFGSLFKSKDETKSRTDLMLMVTPEITEPLNPSDAKPNLYMPRDFLVRLEAKDMPPPPKTSKGKSGSK